MQVLQIDAINTVIRSHYMPLFSRLGAYDRELLDDKMFSLRAQRSSRRTHFEYWGHECSLLPINYYPLFQWRREDAKRGIGVYKQVCEHAKKNPQLVQEIKQRTVAEGPFTCADLETESRGAGMWEWSGTKQVFEHLFWTGELASAGRRGFQRLYASPDSVIPKSLLASHSRDRLADQMTLLESAAAALGVATESDLRDYFRMSAADSKRALARLVSELRLETVQVEEWTEPAFVCPGVTVPRRVDACALLSPFDPIVWCRARAERLFQFHYRIEIYVPAAKRVYGYWVMPFLLGDQIVARLDLKAARDTQRLLVKGVWLEAQQHADAVLPALADKLHELVLWLGLSDVCVEGRGRLPTALRSFI